MCVLGKPCLHNGFQHSQIYKMILPQKKKAVKSPSPSFRLHLLSLLVFHRICQFNGHSLPFPATCLSFSFPDPSFADPSSPQFYQPALKIWSPRASHARVPDSAVPLDVLGTVDLSLEFYTVPLLPDLMWPSWPVTFHLNPSLQAPRTFQDLVMSGPGTL